MKRISSFYNMAWTLCAPVVLPLLLLAKKAKGGKDISVHERFSSLPPVECAKGSTIWCHAISVGELNALLPVACAIRDQNASINLLITTQTAAGLETARRRFPFARAIMCAPLDHPWLVKRFVRRLRPSVLLVMETGYWPNMLSQARSQGALNILAQARMSQRSFQRWARFPGVSKWLLNFFHCITVEDVPTRDRFLAMGADIERLRIVPNTKYDSVEAVPEEKRTMLRQRLGLGPQDPVLVAGSTHPGEERELAMAYQILQVDFPQAIMILAPRRIERVEEIRRQMEDLRLPSQNWTDLHSAGRSAGVVIVDTMGELAALYGIATVAFVGKSLFSPGGGHSLLEPVVQGVPVLHGPFVENSAGTVDQLGRLGAARVVRGSEDVVNQVHRIFRAPEESRSAALEAKEWIETQRGASSTLAKLALEYLTQARPSP